MSYIECGLIIVLLFFSLTGLEIIFTHKSNCNYSSQLQYESKIFTYILYNMLFAAIIMIGILIYSSDPTTCKYTTTTNTKQIQLQQFPNLKEYFSVNNGEITIFIDNHFETLKLKNNGPKFIKYNKKIAIIEEKISTPKFNVFKLKKDREKCKSKKELILKEIHY